MTAAVLKGTHTSQTAEIAGDADGARASYEDFELKIMPYPGIDLWKGTHHSKTAPPDMNYGDIQWRTSVSLEYKAVSRSVTDHL